MALLPDFPADLYAPLLPDQRWFPAAEELRSSAYEKLLPALVARIREEVRKGCEAGVNDSSSPRPSAADAGEGVEFEERWTGGYIFENERQRFRTRQDRRLELLTAPHTYTRAGRYIVAVKVIDIFGNDTMTLVPVSVG